ncbi:hypothetical protein BofuT4_uP106870.1 [Botrytis cinerea T4]|uniref:Uncharacterized protein n=1 Tax=Botryotinia fuckeliana (strain T4) TaxID=999810 RepID=G2Y6Q1_BOTF4|nr:hypothetical protein BofuT4_uP106870.1 [Botrytis cinerea T4]
MEVSVLSYFSSFNRSFILKTLSSIKYGRLYITMKDQNETKPRIFGNTSSDSIDSCEPKCSVIINSPNVWTRMSINVDLVSFIGHN